MSTVEVAHRFHSGLLEGFSHVLATCHVLAYLLLILTPPATTIRKLAISVNSSLSGSIHGLGYLRILLFPNVSRYGDM